MAIDEYGDAGMGHDFHGFASEQRGHKAGIAIGTHDDQVATLMLRRINDGTIRITMAPMERFDLHAASEPRRQCFVEYKQRWSRACSRTRSWG